MDIKYEIQLHTYWHCGSGLAAGADVDALAIKDKYGLPFIPGKTIKGLVREAVDEILTLKSDKIDVSIDYVKTFGYFDKDAKNMEKSEAFFSNACLRKKESDAIKTNGLARFMFDSISQTAIGEKGVARKHSLRRIEIVRPCILEGEILNVPEGMVADVKNGMKYTKYLGLGRNRGLGRCTFTVKKEQEEKIEDKATESAKRNDTLQFKCRLLSDVILNQKAATEGPNTTLDFIPGNNFLGIAASVLYPNVSAETAIELFHAKGVRFGDAHLGKEKSKDSNDNSQNIRGLKVPACMYKPKLGEGLYIMYGTDKRCEDIRKKQLKQCRSGYYDFTSLDAEKIETKTNFAIKSAHDRENRTSAEAQMYGYESLEKDLVLFFEVEVDNDAYKEQIKNALVGKKRIGRSRSAQYGLVEIEETSYTQPKSNQTSGDITIVYADSRLIFLDKETGMPTFQPTSKDLGVEGGEIVWDDCQVRTFQYAPWNFKRKCFDTDRCGIETGSVFVVKGGNLKIQSHVGNYNNEGFGKIIYNPEFLQFKENGEAMYSLKDSDSNKEDGIIPSDKCNLPNSILCVLMERKEAEAKEELIYKLVNIWVHNNKERFTSETFASQWGKIRSLAMQGDIYNRLFAKDIGYLEHGVGEEKWNKGGRKKLLKDFINDTQLKTDKDRSMAVVNLASEMAKIK